MSANCAFDYAIPFDIMVGYWVGTASIYTPKGVYVMSTKSYVSVYWVKPYTELSFRESAEDDFEFKGPKSGYLDSRRGKGIRTVSKKQPPLSVGAGALRSLAFDLKVVGPYCESITPKKGPVHVDGRQTRPDIYQMHVTKTEENGDIHHIYNSHHLPSPDDWHIIGPIAGPVNNVDGQVGLAVVQFFRRISYDVPEASIRELRFG